MKHLVVPHLALICTYRCTLKCKHCGSYIPYYKATKDFDLDRIKRSIERVFLSVDFINVFNISGGEPLLSADIGEITKYIANYSNKIGKIELITNGTIIPKKEHVEIMKSMHNFSVLIDDYGSDLSCNAQNIKALLEENHIPYRLRSYFGPDAWCGGWVDFGSHTRKIEEGNIEKAEKLFSKCTYAKDTSFCFSLVDGIVFPCSKAKRLYELGVLPYDQSEYIDLLREPFSPDSIADAFYNLIYKTRCLRACWFCDGFSDESLRVKPAIQLGKDDSGYMR